MRKTLITACFVVVTVLQGISYPAIALAADDKNTNQNESSSLVTEQNGSAVMSTDTQNEVNQNKADQDNADQNDPAVSDNDAMNSADTDTMAKTDSEETNQATTETPSSAPATSNDSNVSSPATPENGWNQDKSHWYENGQMVRYKFFYDDSSDAWYWAEEDGSIACNKDVFVPDSNTDRSHGKWVRFDEQCRIVKGEDYRYGAWYYFNAKTGEMAKGITHISSNGGKWVYYDLTTGKMQYEERYINYDKSHTGWYYFDSKTGAMAHDFVYHRKANKWVYYDKYTGKMLYGEHCINNGWYYMDTVTGALAKGWKQLKGKKVYYDPTSSRMVHGGIIIDGRHYFFDPYTGARYSKQQIVNRLISSARSQIGKHPDCPGVLAANGGLICPYGPCMSFVWYSFHTADLDIFLCDGAKTGWPHHNYDWYASRGRVSLTPHPGDVVFWQFGGWAQGLSASHAGIVSSVSNGKVRIIDASDGSIAERNAYRGVLGYAHPYYNC